ncbi:hypothetical protein K437DRAFT_258622 [Tilletiaria anomala UBC 951]|uniref:Uncharacterized protein n=1 Tax=Tilletiaria anomala (strain ATCC 24038 / CBS 436.72 / UBC 951) TaxID=1037660 RepID=A0A066VJN6_TILAU|nr:uncharacterized protein K437DRAFT_258622 [Tilletiaria anomala UBC 951]KDN40523.1 hypothetical protein K437DRAFT_258622 [Tilletiaria anomala UBC 951]
MTLFLATIQSERRDFEAAQTSAAFSMVIATCLGILLPAPCKHREHDTYIACANTRSSPLSKRVSRHSAFS